MNLKKHALTILQLAVGFGLLAAIAWRLHHTGELSDMRHAFAATLSHWPWLLLAWAAFGGSLLICTSRWFLVLRAQGFALAFGRVLHLYLVGHFFNAFMLGATGGDVMKAVYVARDSANRKTEIIATVLIERLIGLIAIIVIAPLCMLLRASVYWSQTETRVLLILSGGLFAGTLVGLTLLFGQDVFVRWPWLRRLEDRAPGRILRRLYAATHAVMRHPGLLVSTATLSVMNHLMAVVIACALGRALTLPLGFIDYLAAMVAINLIGSIPITPSGIGTREAASLLLLVPLGASAAPAVTLSLLLYTIVLTWSLLGGGLFLLSSLLRPALPRVAQGDDCCSP